MSQQLDPSRTILVWVFKAPIDFVCLLSIDSWMVRTLQNTSSRSLEGISKSQRGTALLDLYRLAWVVGLCLLVFTKVTSALLTAIVFYRVAEVVAEGLRHFILPPPSGKTLSILSVRRTLLVALLYYATVTLAFAYLYLSSGAIVLASNAIETTGSVLSTAGDAIYFSAVTITTLGYGEFVPSDEWSRFLVMAEVGSGFVILITILPLVLAGIPSPIQVSTDSVKRN